MRTRHALAFLALGLGACSDDGAEGDGAADSILRLRLADQPLGALRSPPADEPVLVLGEDFASGIEGWRVATRQERPLEPDPSLYQLHTLTEDGVSFVRLEGRRAALFRVVPVEPQQAYAFEAAVRDRGIVPSAEPFFGATTWLAELGGEGTAEERLAQGIDPWIESLETFPTARGTRGWQHHRRTFRTGPRTNALVVACLLYLAEDVAAGAVDFSGLRLTRLSDRAYREDLLADEIERLGASEPSVRGEPEASGWRGLRRARASLGAEVRPAVVLFPGEELGFRVTVPRGAPVLETGLGPWRPALLDAFQSAGGRAVGFRVTVDGDELFARDLPPLARPADARWLDERLDLAPWAGRTVTLTLEVTGELPGAFGAPTLRDAAAAPQTPNLVLISIDTLRADHLGCYGYERDTTPRIDAFAAGATRFRDVLSQAPYTLPSHASLFSGQVPSVHGVEATGHVLSPERSPVLARILAQRGYRTQAYTGGGFLNADFGFDQGFDGFATVDPLRDARSDFLALLVERDPERITPELIAEYGPARVERFLAAHASEAFFLFLHTFTVHDYDPPPAWRRCAEEGCASTRRDYREYHLGIAHPWEPQPVTPEDAAHLVHLYDEALRYVDHLVGEILDQLEELGIADRTLVAITTDHGEELFERGFVQHGKTLYGEQTDVPLVLSVPGRAAQVIDTPAMLIDLLPTLLGALGLPPEPRAQGRDLLAPGPAPSRARWSEVRDGYVHRYALQDDAGGWKLIHSPEDPEVHFPTDVRWELYDLGLDGGERENAAPGQPERSRRMQAELLQHREAFRAIGERLGDVGRGAVDEATRIQLDGLGYGGGD